MQSTTPKLTVPWPERSRQRSQGGKTGCGDRRMEVGDEGCRATLLITWAIYFSIWLRCHCLIHAWVRTRLICFYPCSNLVRAPQKRQWYLWKGWDYTTILLWRFASSVRTVKAMQTIKLEWYAFERFGVFSLTRRKTTAFQQIYWRMIWLTQHLHTGTDAFSTTQLWSINS